MSSDVIALLVVLAAGALYYLVQRFGKGSSRPQPRSNFDHTNWPLQ